MCSWRLGRRRRSMRVRWPANSGIRQVLVHPDAGILSAVGIGLADVTRHRSLGVERILDADVARSTSASNSTSWNAKHATKFVREGVADEQIVGDALARPALSGRRQLLSRFPGRRTTILRPRSPPLIASATATSTTAGRWKLPRPASKSWAAWRANLQPASACAASSRRSHGTIRAFFDGRARRRAALRAKRTGRRRPHRRPGDHQRGDVDDGRRTRLAGGRADRRRTAAHRRRRKPPNQQIENRQSRIRRSRIPRSLQQPARQHRRADGRHAAQHGQQRECEGAARFQLRDLHGGWAAGRQRAACAGASRRDGGNGAAHDRGESRHCGPATCSPRTIRTPAARICRTSPW